MHGYIQRLAEKSVARGLNRSPAVAILGPRQCGKSTLVKQFLQQHDRSVYLDLQNRADRNKLTEPELFFEKNREALVCLDEIQRLPGFFSDLRSEIDKDRRPGRFLILGSASRDLIRQSNESLAGRITYIALSPFLYREVAELVDMQSLWLRGGFPESLLSADDENSWDWRKDFISTFLERDIPSLGFSIPAPLMERLWMLLAHYHGQVLNYSKLAEAMDLSVQTLKKYLALLEQTYMVRLLKPYETNLKKRFIKSPKVYIRDSGILHSLLDIETYNELLGHTSLGSSWEGFALEQVIMNMSRWKPSFIRTSNGAEIDLVMQKGNILQVFECKASKAPKPSRGFFDLITNLKPEKAWIVAPVDDEYEYRQNVMVVNPLNFSDFS